MPLPDEPRIEFKRVDQMDSIRAKRKEFERTSQAPFWPWLNDWLAKSDEQHLAEKDPRSTHPCDVCGDTPRFLWYAALPCDEYNCAIAICDKCVADLVERAKEAPPK